MVTEMPPVRINDPDNPHHGEAAKVEGIYYDCFHTGSSPDLYWLRLDDGTPLSLLSTKLDVTAYEAAQRMRDAERTASQDRR